MSDEFIRCPECGNLNIPGTEKCVFCGAELPQKEGVVERVETYYCPNCKTELPITATQCPICGWSKGAEEKTEVSSESSVPQPGVPTPGMPSVPSVPSPGEQKEEVASAESISIPESPELPEISEKIIEEAEVEEVQIQKKSTVVTVLLIILLALLQYAINFLIGWVSISILDQNVELYPTISPNFDQMVSINEFAILLHFLFGVFIGYLILNLVKSRIDTNKQILWFWLVILAIILINIGITALVLGVFMPRNILFTYIALSTAIYLITYVITLFAPNIIGAFLLYSNLNNIFAGKKPKQAQKV